MIAFHTHHRLLIFLIAAIATISPARAADPPQAKLTIDGYIQSWLVLGPFRNENPNLDPADHRIEGLQNRTDCFGFNHDLLAPRGGESHAQPAAGDELPHSPSVFGDHSLRWKPAEAKQQYLDLHKAFNTGDPPPANLVAYACTYIQSSEARPIHLKVKSDDAIKLWLNGRQIHDHFVRRGVQPTDDVPAQLKKGTNVLLAKVDQASGGWSVAVQLLTKSGMSVVNAGWQEFVSPEDRQVRALVIQQHARATARFTQLQQTAAAAGLTDNPYIDCGLYITPRFLERIATERDRQTWKLQQLKELDYVLSQTEDLIKSITAGTAPPLDVPRPTGGPVTVKDGRFMTPVTPSGALSPYYFYGYGHWGEARRDIPNFHRLGVNLIQQTKAPAWAMAEDGTYIGGKLTGELQCPLESARQHNMKVDMLIELHSIRESVLEANPDLPTTKGGFIKYNIDHPVAREIARTFVEGLMADIKDNPALFSVCLSNEPSYRASGFDKYSRPLYTKFLQQQHGTIAKLNELYATNYTDFAAIPPPEPGRNPESRDIPFRRALYDWAVFNYTHFLDWHEWLNTIVKDVAPDVPTHTKTIWMVLDQEHAREGYDPGRMSAITDLAGIDLAAYYHYENDPEQAKLRFYRPEDAFGWCGQALGNDFHYSIKGRPVFNSEHHIIPSRSHTTDPVPPQHTRAALWHGALHHMAACTIWVWHEPIPGHDALQGSIYIRPANMYAASRTMFDLNRLAKQVAAVSNKPAKIALLYSYTSTYWDDQYPTDMMDAYVALTFLGHPVGFVTERQLADGTFKDYDVIIVPNVRAITDIALAGLKQHTDRGARIILYGKDNFARDEYWQQRRLDAKLFTEAHIIPSIDNAQSLSHELYKVLATNGQVTAPLLDTTTGHLAWGVDYRVVRRKDAPTLVSAINVLKHPVTLSMHLEGAAVDLITGDHKDLTNLKLAPMQFVLLEVK